MSDYVQFEIGAAWVLGKPIFPLIFGLGENAAVPPVLNGLISRDLENRDDLTALGRDLSETIFDKIHSDDEIDLAVDRFTQLIKASCQAKDAPQQRSRPKSRQRRLGPSGL